MNLSERFLNHMQECQRMSSTARASQDKANWNQMAERWLVCAEYYEHQQAALETRRAEDRHRRTHSG